MHGVLNPSAPSQVILVERTLTGAVDIPDTSFDASDPIISAGGIAISGATVEIIDSTGRVTRGVEDKIGPANQRQGRRRLSRADLRARRSCSARATSSTSDTTDGEDVTASTRIPQPSIAARTAD